jgi:hypothetical protein
MTLGCQHALHGGVDGTYIRRKGKAEGNIAADVYATMFLFIPMTLSKPEP